MEERRKILIPVGAEPETPHFDAEETLLSARPVVPITRTETAPVFNNPHVAERAPFYRRSAFLSLIVIAAVGIGLAAGLAIARYRYMQRNASTVVARPAAETPVVNDTRTTATVQTPKDEEQAQAPTLPEVNIEEKTTGDDDAASKDDEARVATPGASSKAEEDAADRSKGDKGDKDDNARATAPATRDKKRKSDDDEDEIQDTPRAQRRARRVRDRDDEAVNIPRRVERASEQINRIREIFEGRPQRP